MNTTHAAVAAHASLAALICYRWHRHGYDGLLVSNTGRCIPVRQSEMPPGAPYYPLTVRKATLLVARSVMAGHDYVTSVAHQSAA